MIRAPPSGLVTKALGPLALSLRHLSVDSLCFHSEQNDLSGLLIVQTMSQLHLTSGSWVFSSTRQKQPLKTRAE